MTTLRLATFNVWNHDTAWPQRLAAICEEIKMVNPDVIALQEVKSADSSAQDIDVA